MANTRDSICELALHVIAEFDKRIVYSQVNLEFRNSTDIVHTLQISIFHKVHGELESNYNSRHLNLKKFICA